MTPNPKAVADQLAAVVATMKKHGEATVIVTRVSYANDPDFFEHPPSCRVTVTVTDPADRTFSPKTFTSDLFSAPEPKNTCTFTIPVEKIFKLWFKKPRTLRVTIAADPINGFEEYYESRPVETVEIAAGTTKPWSVSLKPIKPGWSTTGPKTTPPNRLNP